MYASVEIDTNWTVLLLWVVVGLKSLFKISYLLLVSNFLLSYKDILWYNQINGTRILCPQNSLVFAFFISTQLKLLSPDILDGGTEIWIRQAYRTQLVYLGALTQSDHNIVWEQLTGMLLISTGFLSSLRSSVANNSELSNVRLQSLVPLRNPRCLLKPQRDKQKSWTEARILKLATERGCRSGILGQFLAIPAVQISATIDPGRTQTWV